MPYNSQYQLQSALVFKHYYIDEAVKHDWDRYFCYLSRNSYSLLRSKTRTSLKNKLVKNQPSSTLKSGTLSITVINILTTQYLSTRSIISMTKLGFVACFIFIHFAIASTLVGIHTSYHLSIGYPIAHT